MYTITRKGIAVYPRSFKNLYEALELLKFMPKSSTVVNVEGVRMTMPKGAVYVSPLDAVDKKAHGTQGDTKKARRVA